MADIKHKKQKVRYEFFQYQGTVIGGLTQVNLILEQPAEIRFVCSGAPGTSYCLINKIYGLASVTEFTGGASISPYELILKNNLDEIDVTNYSILMTTGCQVRVICKYFVN